MYDIGDSRVSGRQQSAGDRTAVPKSSPLDIRTSVAVDYWVIDETGGLADPDCTVMLPGAASTDSPCSVTVETPLCGSCGELRDELDARLRRTVTAAHDRGCRLLPLGLRPDLLAEGSPAPELVEGSPAPDEQPRATAGTRIGFETDRTAVADIYNILLALDPAFALVNTTRLGDACGRPACHRHHQTMATYRSPEDGESVEESATTAAWQSVEQLDGRTVVWQSLDPVPPTLLVDLIADICTILHAASEYRIEIESFGNGFRANRLVLPDAEWRARYVQEAVEKGLSSLPLCAYLERLGLSTDWYRASRPPTVDVRSSTDLPTICRQRAADLEADVGVRLTN